jgi:hypothetical protein
MCAAAPKLTCRVVTVLDNIIEYSDRLAYHTYFTPYFQSP